MGHLNSRSLRVSGVSLTLRLAVAVAIVTLVLGCAQSPPSTSVDRQPSVPASATPAARPTPPSVPLDADFDADGSPDIAFGSGQATTGELTEDDGTVVVVYGSAQGLTPQRTQTWKETDFGGPITSSFGEALATGDFDGDGFSDLAVGAADAPVDDAKEHAGVVRIIYGSATGLRGERSQRWSQNSPGIADHAEDYDGFGISLVGADFGYGAEHDLAVGVPGENRDAGAVTVIYGSPSGLTADYDQLWSQNSAGVADRSEKNDSLGLTLTAGRFHDSGYADLAVGVYSESFSQTFGGGAVHILHGTSDGITAEDSQFLTFPAGHKRQEGAGFSYALTAGRFHGGDTDDLAVGAPFADGNIGAVTVFPSTSEGLLFDKATVFDHRRLGIAKSPDEQDTIGWALTAGQFGRDNQSRYADLAIRAPGYYTKNEEINGALSVLYGGPDGLTTQRRQILTRGLSSDAFGIDVQWRRQLTAISTAADGLDELVLGDTDWIRILTPTEAGFPDTAPRTWTTKTLNRDEEVWYGLADTVTG